MNAIELRDVRLALGGRIILDSVSLDIAACEFVGVLGPNGAGKTTLMRAILGLVPPSTGQHPRAGPAGGARQSRHRLHAAGARRDRARCG